MPGEAGVQGPNTGISPCKTDKTVGSSGVASKGKVPLDSRDRERVLDEDRVPLASVGECNRPGGVKA